MKKLYTLLLTLSFAAISAQAATKTVKHTIKDGETLYTIAHKNHTTIEEVKKANGLKSGEMLKLGRVLTVPKNTYFPEKQANAKKDEKKKTTKVAKKKSSAKKKLAKQPKKNKTKIVKLKKEQPKKKLAKAKIKNKKSNRALKVALVKNAKRIKQKRVKRHYVGDILFKTAKLNIMSFGAGKKGGKIISLAKKKLGRRYVWGATGQRNTFDCSGLTTYVYKKNGIRLPRRAIAQSRVGKRVSRYNLKKGDLVFFDTSKRRKGYVNHVGIYIGNGKFIHASSAKKKVVITSLNKPFYAQRFKGGRRLASS